MIMKQLVINKFDQLGICIGHIVRVYKTPEGSSYDKKSLVVMKEPEETFVEFAMNKERSEERRVGKEC